jgi:hypothetical protein
MTKDNDEKNKKDLEEKEFGDYKTNKKISSEIHEKAKNLGYDYILEKLKKYGFSNAEELAKKILEDKKE